MDESKTSVNPSRRYIDNITEETWDKIAADICRGFHKYNLAETVPWNMQPPEAKQIFTQFIKDLAERLYRSDTKTGDACRIAHEVSREMMTKRGWEPGMWNEKARTHPDMAEWSEVSDPIRIKYAFMVLILSTAMKYHGHPVLMHLLP